MKFLLLDTETNGLPKNRFAPASQWEMFPAILQLSWALYELQGRQLKRIRGEDSGVALHRTIPWDEGAAKIHGISEIEGRYGIPAAVALANLAVALRETDVVVAHNLSFDKAVLRAAGYAEAHRDPECRPLRTLWPSTGLQGFCTMEMGRELLKIPLPSDPTSGKWKAPKLNELYTWLYGHVYDMSGAVLHTAKSDMHCLEQCINGLFRRGILKPAEPAETRQITYAASSPASA